MWEFWCLRVVAGVVILSTNLPVVVINSLSDVGGLFLMLII